MSENKAPERSQMDEAAGQIEQEFKDHYKGLQRITAPLAERLVRMGITANAVTVFRGFLVVPMVYLLQNNYFGYAILTFAFSMCLDFVDGRLALTQDKIDPSRTQADRISGGFYDALADKIFWGITTIVLYICLWHLYATDTISLKKTHVIWWVITTAFAAGSISIEGLLLYVRIEDFKQFIQGRTSLEKSADAINSKISGKFKMLSQSISTGGVLLYLYLTTIFAQTQQSGTFLLSIVFAITIFCTVLAMPFAYRSYKAKRP